MSTGPSVVSTASRCCGLSWERKDKLNKHSRDRRLNFTGRGRLGTMLRPGSLRSLRIVFAIYGSSLRSSRIVFAIFAIKSFVSSPSRPLSKAFNRKGRRGRRKARKKTQGDCLLLAGQLFARQLQPVQVSQDGDRDVVRLKELIGEFLQLFSGDGLNFGDQFIQPVEVIKVHLLARQV